ncbi:hypothetical protein ACFE04_024509 [Oxalis oulophora]
MASTNLSPLLREELENLQRDPNARKSAIKALKSHVKDLDSKAIPMFLAHVSDIKETGSVSGEYTVSLYQVLARDHGPKIVPHINTIMTTIIKTLASSAGSLHLQQACSKVVITIFRYAIDPATDENKRKNITQSICRPLSDSLMGSLESLTSGAALCLEAIVDSDNWRFACDEMVNKVCLNVAGALEEKCTQTNSHMSLVTALAKHNPLIVEAYARLLIKSGLQILKRGVLEGNSQKRLSAIQMVNNLMKCLDPRSIFSELEFVIEEMEKCESDNMAFIRGAAFEALQTAKKIFEGKKSKFENGNGSVSGSNFSRRNLSIGEDRSPRSMSPESQILDSCLEYNSLVESPVLDQRSVNRKLWSYRNEGMDLSFKNAFCSEISRGRSMEHTYYENDDNREMTNDGGGYRAHEFAGFDQRSSSHRMTRSATPSPQRSRHHLNIDNIDIYTTPRKLVQSLQDPSAPNSYFSEKQTRRFRSQSHGNFDFSPITNQNGFSRKLNGNGDLRSEESESVSSTNDALANVDPQVSHEVDDGRNSETPKVGIEKSRGKFAPSLVLSLLVTILSVSAYFWFDGHDEGYRLVPT